MDDKRFDGMRPALIRTTSRRGALAVMAGFGLAALSGAAGAKKRTRPRRGPRARVAAESAPGSVFVTEGHSDAERVYVYATYERQGRLKDVPVWDHTDLTATVHAGGNADPALVAAIREALAVWGDVLDRHFAGLVTLTDVTDDHQQDVNADLRIHFIPHWGSYKFAGMAVCGDAKCNNIYVKSEWPSAACCKDLNDTVWEVTPRIAGQLALHEIGHALGLGHAVPLTSTDDIMGYGFLPWFNLPPRDPVLSDCDLKVLDAVFAWRLNGTAPQRPSITEIVC